MKIQIQSRARREGGYTALFITLVLVGASLLVLGATLSRSTSSSRLTDRNTLFISSDGAAEAAVEKALSRMMVDFANGGESLVQTNLSLYKTALLPTTAESSYWSNFVWSDGQGNNNQIYVARTTTGANAPYIALEEQYSGLSGYASTYRVLANVAVKSSSYSYSFTNAVQQDVQLAQIPVFQFAIFYNGLLEFSDTATLVVSGPVHANSNIYVGSPAALTFNSVVTTTGNITKPANAGYGTSSWTGTTTYNGAPTPGYLTGQPSLNLPIGTNSNSGTNVQQILYAPPGAIGQSGSEAYNTAMGVQRYWNKAYMTLVISNTFFTATFKSAPGASQYVFSTNITYQTNVNWNWFNTTNSLYDFRENKTVNLTQIDIGKMTNWMATWVPTNTGTSGMFGANNPFNILYVVDYRTTNSSILSAIQLMDGTNLPTAGLTIATPNPLYIWGVYNCPVSADLNTTNTLNNSAPASVACDALTILSPAWQNLPATITTVTTNKNSHGVIIGYSTNAPTTTELTQTAANDTVNTAIITGIVPSTGINANQYSGGANNLPRLLEDWRTADLTLNTSIVCLFSSTWATGPFVLPGAYYYAPALRQFNFDQNYTSSLKMPPGTPSICRLVRAAWCNPPPGTVSFAPSPTLDFVPQ